MEALSPRRDLRALPWDKETGTWGQHYKDEIRIGELADVPGRPVVVHGTSTRGKNRDPWWKLFGNDFDAKRHPAELAANHAYMLGAYLDAIGIPYVIAVSGPSLGRHLWFTIPATVPGELVRRYATAAKRVFPTFDHVPLMNLSGYGALRPPGSPHRDGGHSTLESATIDEAISRLTAGGTPAQFETLTCWLEEEVAFLPAEEAEEEKRDRRPSADDHGAPRKTAPSARGAGAHLPPSVTRHGDHRVRAVEQDGDGHLKLPGEPRAFGERAHAALTTPLAPEQQHSDRAFAAIRGIVRSHLSNGQGWELALSGIYPGLAYITTARVAGATNRTKRSTVESRRIFDRQWMLAVEVEARRPLGHAEAGDPAPEVTQAVGAWWEHINSFGPAYWSARGRPSMLANAWFTGLQMLAAATLTVSLGCRRAADATGFSHETCNAAMNRLIDAELLLELERDARYANRRFTLPPELVADLMAKPLGEPSNSGLTQSLNGGRGGRGVWGGPDEGVADTRTALRDHGDWAVELIASDFFAHGGEVGHFGAHTWMIMETAQGLLSLGGLIQKTGFGKRTVLRHLAAFTRAGLVEGNPTTGWTVTGKSIEEASRQCRTAGTREARAVRHMIDRIMWGWWTDEVEWRRLPLKAKRLTPRVPSEQQAVAVPDGVRRTSGRQYPRRACGAADHSAAERLLRAELLTP
ncbi:hypothetical protein ACFVIM_30895 [Streptomyces sp. NPDC057638]|uniref:hypothetical protein n=1 Tax=Streptomyces sp. NPDC057638 TaxID=3346190 RepID=UPI0036838F91